MPISSTSSAAAAHIQTGLTVREGFVATFFSSFLIADRWSPATESYPSMASCKKGSLIASRSSRLASLPCRLPCMYSFKFTLFTLLFVALCLLFGYGLHYLTVQRNAFTSSIRLIQFFRFLFPF